MKVDLCFLNLHLVQFSYGKAIQVCKVIYFIALLLIFLAPFVPSGLCERYFERLKLVSSVLIACHK